MIRRAPAVLLALVLVWPAVASADVRITELMYDVSGADAKREWVEVHNTGSEPVDLSNLKFSDASNHALNAPPKNGGTGSLVLAPGAYAVLASDARTFLAEHPAVAHVIDTVMSLNNSGATVSLTKNGAVVDRVAYSNSHGAGNDGDSLQLHDSEWIHARPTPGAINASRPSFKAESVVPKAIASQKEPEAPVAKTEQDESENDPQRVVNAEPVEVSAAQVAAVGSLGGSYWWFAAAALAIITGAVVTLISRVKKNEWDIEESE